MTTAVLKNRLLNLTRGQFSEDRYGSPSFIHLVRRIPDLVTVISEQPPHHLRLVTSAPSHGGAASLSSASTIEVDAAVTEPGIGDDELAGMRVRDDLWHAIIDYSTGKPYVYDPQSRIARPWVHGDLALPQFPTVSRDTVATWRDDFVASLDQATREKSATASASGQGVGEDRPICRDLSAAHGGSSSSESRPEPAQVVPVAGHRTTGGHAYADGTPYRPGG
jgi:hypothetical protein